MTYLVIVEPTHTLFRYLRIARQQGLRTLVLTRDPEGARVREAAHYADTGEGEAAGPGFGAEQSRIDETVRCDVTSSAAIVAALAPYAGRVAGILPGDEVFVPPALAAGSALGFDCAAPEDARCQHVKSAMKERLVARGVRTPPFRTAYTWAEAEAAWLDFDRDCMVKMVDFTTSAHIYRATTRDELAAAWHAITAEAPGVDTPFPQTSHAVLERFVGGREVSAEGYVSGDRVGFISNCEKVTSDRFVVVDHLVPARLSAAERAAVEEVATECVRALGIRNSVFHVEIHIQDGVPYVIECASRPPGQQMAELIRRAYAVDLQALAVELATGGRPEVARPVPVRWFALLTLYADSSGTLTGVHGLAELRQRGVLRHWHLRAQVGDQVQALRTFQQRYGWVQIEAASEDDLLAHLEWAQRHLRLTVAREADVGGLAVAGSEDRQH